jgi:uncharacterized protein
VTVNLKVEIEALRQRAGTRPVGSRESLERGGAVQTGFKSPLAPEIAPTATSHHLSGEELAERLGGRHAAEGLIVIERRVPLGALHGRWPLGGGLATALGFFGHGDGRAVFLDTETTGLAGGTGTVAFLIGLAWVTESQLEVMQFLLSKFVGEAELLRTAETFIADSTTVITYNGKSFDVPLLTTRFRLEGLRDPFRDLTHVDLLHSTRRLFRKKWSDCRLPTAEERLLHLRRQDDLAGSDVPHAWLDWIRFGHWGDLPRVLRHNALDVASLVSLVPALYAAHASGADVPALR